MPLYMTRIVVKHRDENSTEMKTLSSGKLCYLDCRPTVFIFRALKSKHSHSSRTTTPWRWILINGYHKLCFGGTISITHNYTLNYLVSGLVHHLIFSTEYVFGSISSSMIKWKGGEAPTYLGVLQRAITDHWKQNQIISKALYQEVSFYVISFCAISL
jgi:uncharacterized protein YjhX (UPF0386 family)